MQGTQTWYKGSASWVPLVNRRAGLPLLGRPLYLPCWRTQHVLEAPISHRNPYHPHCIGLRHRVNQHQFHGHHLLPPLELWWPKSMRIRLLERTPAFKPPTPSSMCALPSWWHSPTTTPFRSGMERWATGGTIAQALRKLARPRGSNACLPAVSCPVSSPQMRCHYTGIYHL